MKRSEVLADLTALLASLMPIDSDCHDDDGLDEGAPCKMITLGIDPTGWNYQTGDNSFTGGAYGFATWGIGYITNDSNPESVARALLADAEECWNGDGELFETEDAS